MASPSKISGRNYAPSCQSLCDVSSVPLMPSIHSRKTLCRIGGDCTQMHLSSSGGDQNGGIRRPPPRRALKKVSSVCSLLKITSLVPEKRILNIAIYILIIFLSRSSKRKNKRREKMDQLLRKTGFESGGDVEFLEDLGYIETRPMRRIDAVEAGLDYWIDETDLEKERQRRIATKNRKVCQQLVLKRYFI